MIHGWKGNEDVMWIFERTLPQNWLVVAPRAILPDPDGGYTWYPHPAPGYWPTREEFEPALGALDRFLTTLPELYDADLDETYLMGFSQGAAAALALAATRPGRFQGLAALVGFAPERLGRLSAPVPLRDLPTFMAVGVEDDRIPLAVARRGAALLRLLGADLTYQEYPTGHRLNGDGMRDLSDWWSARPLF
jgi:phospholipase/carboxylesterase